MEGNSNKNSTQDEMELRRGPWTVEEDLTLINYIATNGEGRWNSLARSAGLKRTGKSCRLRWLNYLRPDVRRGNITLQEQLLILELHSRWGNRWSKIAQYLPGRTDNEIKNYWRTRVQKHAKQLKCDVNSKQFKDTVRYLWMPRLMERIQAAATTAPTTATSGSPTAAGPTMDCSNINQPAANLSTHAPMNSNFTPENSANSSDSLSADFVDYYGLQARSHDVNLDYQVSYSGYNFNSQGMEYQGADNSMEQSSPQQWFVGDTVDHLWSVEDIYVLQQLNNRVDYY